MTSFGLPHRHLRLTDSTNERARELIAGGAPSGTIVTAAEQTAGRGRRGRTWSAPAGAALLLSAILRPLGSEHALLPLAVPVAACEAIESVAAVECKIKWPNDIWIAERKVGGILIEARPPDWAVIGIGINVSVPAADLPRDLRWPAASVGHGSSVDALRAALCEELSGWVDAPVPRTLAFFNESDVLLGRPVSWEGAATEPGTGIAQGVDERGDLVVELAGGERVRLGSGEVRLRPD